MSISLIFLLIGWFGYGAWSWVFLAYIEHKNKFAWIDLLWIFICGVFGIISSIVLGIVNKYATQN